MLQPSSISAHDSHQNGKNSPPREYLKVIPEGRIPLPTAGVDIQQELNRLEDIILSSMRIPLTGRTLVDEDTLLEQLDFIRLSLPTVFQEALDILAQKDEILL
ncbi:MAG: DivIVA domain-containing protein, partial [Dolichospermum sp.]